MYNVACSNPGSSEVLGSMAGFGGCNPRKLLNAEFLGADTLASLRDRWALVN